MLHFIVIGFLFFLIYSAVNGNSDNSSDIIHITPQRINQIATGFSGVWNRMPTEDELDKLIEEEIRLEIYHRDALALGLDKNDAVVRRRMRQKMEFLTDTGVYLKEPEEDELKRYFAANEPVYWSEPRLAFEQIYFGEVASEDIISGTLKALLSEPAMDPSTLGQRTLLPAQLKLLRPDAIDSVFGKGFYSQLVELESGVWGGPVTSAYGTHLVRALDGLPARLPPLEEIRDTVLKDWKSAKVNEYREQDYIQRRGRYIIEISRRATNDIR